MFLLLFWRICLINVFTFVLLVVECKTLLLLEKALLEQALLEQALLEKAGEMQNAQQKTRTKQDPRVFKTLVLQHTITKHVPNRKTNPNSNVLYNRCKRRLTSATECNGQSKTRYHLKL